MIGQARHMASPNSEARRNGLKPDMLILHYTGMATAEAACAWLCAPESGVSCHYLVDEAGAITALVDETRRAWHAGVSCWQGETDINSRSIGIEIHNRGHNADYPDFPPGQMDAVARLSADICRRHGIVRERVLAHSDVAPARKIDPGEKFDWQYLWRRGVGHWAEPSPAPESDALRQGDQGLSIMALQAKLAVYGYAVVPTGSYDDTTRCVVSAFQRHFHQFRIDGEASPALVARLDRLLATLPGGRSGLGAEPQQA